MNEIIYYPTFEVGNVQWLKFALLYLDKLNPIIPPSGKKELTDQFKQLENETDLIDVHKPSYDEGCAATLDAIEHVNKILKRPNLYRHVFTEGNFLERWKDPKEQVVTLYSEKFSDDWKAFCIAENLGQRTDDGLLVNEQVADVYMTLLAHVIGDKRGIPPLSDDPNLDCFGVFTRKSHVQERDTVQTAQAIIELELPANLEEISISSIIEHRRNPDFKKRQGAFHEALNAYMSDAENKNKPGLFNESMQSAWSEFRDDILRVGSGVASFGLGVWLLAVSEPVGTLKAAGQIAGGVSLVVGSSIAIKNTWRNTETKRWARKYLADLTHINPQE